MSIAKIENALKSANDKMAELRSAITEYDDEGRSLRAKLNAHEERFEEVNAMRRELYSIESSINRALSVLSDNVHTKKDTSVNRVLTTLRDCGGWIHYEDLAALLTEKGLTTTRGNAYTKGSVASALTALKKEGQVHNSGNRDGLWRYGKGER